jgi:hypothetical protein
MPCKKRWTQTEKKLEPTKMTVSREVTESYPEKMEANPEGMKSIVEHQEVLK